MKAAVKAALAEAPPQIVIQPDAQAWNVSQCAEYLGVSDSQIRKLVNENAIPFFKAFTRIGFHPHLIRNWEGTKEMKRRSKADMAVEQEIKMRGKKRGAK